MFSYLNFKPSCLVIGFISLTHWQLGYANNNPLNLSISQLQTMGITAEQVKKVNWVPSNMYPAQGIIPLNTIRLLSSPLAGQIVKLNYLYGPIQKEQIIAEIESPDLLKIQEQLLATLSDLRTAQQSLKRSQSLNKSGVSSTKNLQQAGNEVKKLNLKKTQLQKKLSLIGMADNAIHKLINKQKLQPAILQLKSPIDGQLFDLKVRLGERISQNQTLISLGANNPLILVVHVPIAVANNLTINQTVEIQGVDKNGYIQRIDTLVDPMTQSVDIHISVENNQGKLRVGQLFKIRFLNQATTVTYQAPVQSISNYQGNTIIFASTASQKEEVNIRPIPIKVFNITDGQLFFTPLTTLAVSEKIYTSGATAIKSALEAIESSSE